MALSQAGIDRLNAAMVARVNAGQLPGLVMLLAQGDDVSVSAIGAYGFGDADPMRRDTVFRIASLTKPVVGVAAMMLVEDGVLALDQPIDDVLPELANRRVLRAIDGAIDDTGPARRPITLADVLSYRMGYGMIIEPSFEPPFPVVQAANALQLTMAQPHPRTPHNPDEWIKRFASLPLMYEPGERWQYNASGLVLGVLVSRAAKQPLPDLLQARIFDPLGMTSTSFWTSEPMPIEYATDFETGALGLLPGTPLEDWARPPAFPSGSAGLVSTIDDYFRFATMMRDGGRGLLSTASIDQMTTNQLTDDEIARGGMILGGRGWGLGISVSVRPDDVSATPGRYGWEGGSGTSWFNDPSSGVTAILLSQTSDVLFNGTLNEFGRLAIEAAA